MRDWRLPYLIFYALAAVLNVAAGVALLVQPMPFSWLAALPAVMLVWALVDISEIASDA